ncbi:uncharacterized protein DUF4352 [Ruminiclostridium sufflavum DSM 19573]|uniref:Uncharacterized protein DUF4352 n=1 Tax=Ruminiclostridium sufflavum DSM 19573 TaxID=1121337 RepID=A0A318YBR6_9FIRM|nr:DUF5067 domain-containing protein [Ruminiclostridium sufflavum]PYG90132.1 uncharacterized protein DUF4352 [Ruminiclostridium sufflavum DSM 19573]
MDKLVNCKTCKAEIASSTKKCPQCGARNKKSILKNWWFWVAAVVILIAVLVNLGDDADKAAITQAKVTSQNQKEEPKKKEQEGDKENIITKPNDSIETKNFRVSLESLNRPKGSEFNTPADGKEFVAVTLLIENISSKDYTISSLLMFNAYQDGFSINESISAQMANPDINTLDGALAAGKKLRGELAYELPTDWKELEINVDLTKLSLSTDGEIKIKLKNE